MQRIALTGGIASGKSMVANMMGELGAVIIDADVLARDVVEPGTPGLAAIVERFGPEILLPDGTLNRPALGNIVFSDEQARLDLNAIVHPLVRQRADQLDAQAGDAVVIHVIPLLIEAGLVERFPQIVVVDVPVDVQLQRLQRRDCLSRDEAQARINAQASREERLAVATWVIKNSGSLDETRRQVNDWWAEIHAL